MHELTLVEALLDILDEEKRRRGFERLKRIKLEIGRFSCVDADAIIYAFEITTRGSWLDGVAVEVDRPPGVVECLDCGATAQVDDRLAVCPKCQGQRLQPVGGDEMKIVEIEILH